MSNLDKQHIFEAWLTQSMTPEQRQAFEALCTEDSEFAARVQSINLVADIADDHQEIQPPQWYQEGNEEHFFAPNNSPSDGKVHWWQWRGIPITSLAFSIAALLMILTGFNIEYTQDRVSIGFGHTISDDQIENIVQARIAQFQNTNAQVFNQYLDALKDQQLTINSQLTEYVLSSNRQERREDFAELFKLINQQRYDDQVFFARQLNDLQNEISLKTGVPIESVRPVNDVVPDE